MWSALPISYLGYSLRKIIVWHCLIIYNHLTWHSCWSQPKPDTSLNTCCVAT